MQRFHDWESFFIDTMIFGRQWLTPGSQIGLHRSFKIFWEIFSQGDFLNAKNTLKEIQGANDIDQLILRKYIQRLNLICDFALRKPKESQIKVYLKDFWEGFDFNNHPLKGLLELSMGKKVIATKDPKKACFCLCSIFTDSSKSEDNASHLLKILFIGERVSPAYYEYDYSISMDIDSYGGKNIYFPLFIYSLAKAFGLKDIIDGTYASIPDYHDIYNKRLHKAIYIGNNDHPIRKTIINSLDSLGIETDTYGSMSRPVADKISTMKKYLYAICPENTWSPGYITEKLVDAKLAGCIPIYWGGLSNTFFDEKALINLNPYRSIADQLMYLGKGLSSLKYCGKRELFYKESISDHIIKTSTHIHQILKAVC